MSDPKGYPEGWVGFSLWIRYGRARGRCECEGECGLHRDHPGPRRCVERDKTPATWARGDVMLTVAHLNADGGPCQCDPLCMIKEHVKAMCQRCHLRYDHDRHQRNRRRNREDQRSQARFGFGELDTSTTREADRG